MMYKKHSFFFICEIVIFIFWFDFFTCWFESSFLFCVFLRLNDDCDDSFSLSLINLLSKIVSFDFCVCNWINTWYYDEFSFVDFVHEFVHWRFFFRHDDNECKCFVMSTNAFEFIISFRVACDDDWSKCRWIVIYD